MLKAQLRGSEHVWFRAHCCEMWPWWADPWEQHSFEEHSLEPRDAFPDRLTVLVLLISRKVEEAWMCLDNLGRRGGRGKLSKCFRLGEQAAHLCLFRSYNSRNTNVLALPCWLISPCIKTAEDHEIAFWCALMWAMLRFASAAPQKCGPQTGNIYLIGDLRVTHSVCSLSWKSEKFSFLFASLPPKPGDVLPYWVGNKYICLLLFLYNRY